MKLPTFAILLSVIAGFGCTVPNDSSIRFLNAHEFTTGPAQSGCSPQNIAIYRGSLDLAGNDRYYVSFDWESALESITTVATSDTIAGPQRNDFVLDHFIFNYNSTPSYQFQSEQVDAYAILRAGATGPTSWLGVSLITPQAQRVLLQNVQPSDYNGLELRVQFQAFGALASGQKISTNKVTYPIAVYRSGFTTCRVAGDIRAPTGPCGDVGGQDGTVVACCKDITPTLQGCPTQ